MSVRRVQLHFVPDVNSHLLHLTKAITFLLEVLVCPGVEKLAPSKAMPYSTQVLSSFLINALLLVHDRGIKMATNSVKRL